MKKLVWIALALLPITASAGTNYLQADVIYGKLESKDSAAMKDNAAGGRISWGTTDGAVRYALDYTYHGSFDKQYPAGYYEAKAHSVGVSAFYDFKNKTALTPYIGARVGLSYLSDDLEIRSNSGYIRESRDNTDVALGALAGVHYWVSPKVGINVAAEYHDLGKTSATSIFTENKIKQYGGNIGVRFDY